MKTNNVFINPLTDFGFKRVFASEENKDILIAFLNDCISDHVGVIREIRFLSSEHIGLAEAEKKLIFDIYCTNERGQRFIIEMQRARQDYFADRVITYISRIISNEASRGAHRYDIPPVYSFNILDYNAPEFMGREEYFWAVHLKDNQNRFFSKKIILFFMELSKFAAQFPDEKSPAYKWGYALKNMSRMSLKDMPEEAGEFRKLFEVCQMSSSQLWKRMITRRASLNTRMCRMPWSACAGTRCKRALIKEYNKVKKRSYKRRITCWN